VTGVRHRRAAPAGPLDLLAAAERVAAAGIIVAPAYTEHIGHYLQAWLAERQAEAA
jgi:hypothetical protein